MKRGLLHAATCALLVVSWSSIGFGAKGHGALAARTHVGAGSIAAGRAHTVVATPDGRVFAWGAGHRGQLGIGGLADRLLPTALPSPVGIVSVSAGSAHTVALAATGEVYAWGANAFGRIGDGTRKRRDRPVKVAGLRPITMIAAGRAHTLALTDDGRVFAWGWNAHGQIGNGRKAPALSPLHVKGLADVVAIAAGEAHSLAVTRDGRVFAWGKNSSSELGDGSTKDRDTPVLVGLRDVVGVAAGGAHSLALLRSGLVYSWGRGANGELGTGETRPAPRPKLIAGLTAKTIAAGRHFSGAITTGGKVVTWGANDVGQLGDGTTTRRLRPTDVVGITSASSLALGALHGLAVTTDGDLMTWGEGQRGRLGTGTERDQATSIEVISDVPDWGEAPGSDPDPADAVAPTIRAVTVPPLAGGWMTAPVTVSFECEDNISIASCSTPVVVNQDGVTTVTGTAVDSAGNRSTTSVSVHLDLQSPVVTIAAVPETTDGEVIAVSGSFVDVGSGVADASCNGQLLNASSPLFSCSVVLRPGRNDVVVQVRDAVGRESSAAVTIAKVGVSSALFLTPASRTVALNAITTLTLRDEFGAAVADATWTAEDEGIVALTDDDPPAITAVGAGETLVVAEKGGLRAEALIRVVPVMMAGEERWSLPSTQMLSPEPPLIANRVASDSPHLFAIDYEDWDKKLVRAVSSEGEVMWQQHVPGIPLMADTFGGIVAALPDQVGDYRGFLRTGGGTTRSWRYNSPGILDRPAQAYDGTIYTIESVPNGKMADGHEMRDKFAIAIDGATGQLIAKTLLPAEVNEFISQYDGEVTQTVPPISCRSYRYEYAPAVIGPIAGADGRGYFVVRRHKIVKRDLCVEPIARRPERAIEMGLDLVVLSRTAPIRTTTLFSTACEAGPGTGYPCDHPANAVQLMPDGLGGMIVTWERGTRMIGNAVLAEKVITVVHGDSVINREVPFNFSIEMIGQDGLALTYGDEWKAIDVRSGDTKWNGALVNLTPVAARPDGGVAAIDWSTNELAAVNASGEIEARQPFGLDWRSVHLGSDWVGLKGEALAAVAGEFDDATRFSLFDYKTGQLSARRPGIGVWLKTHSISPTSYQHASIRVTPADQAWLIENRSRFESCSGAQPCVPIERDRFANYFFTIGAGPGGDDTNMLCTGILAKGFNRPLDVRKPETQPLTQIPVDFSLESLVINSLINRFDAYANTVTYHCFPEEFPGLYNSNSFAHGLLHAASVAHSEEPPTRGAIPGWLSPVPLPAFFRK